MGGGVYFTPTPPIFPRPTTKRKRPRNQSLYYSLRPAVNCFINTNTHLLVKIKLYTTLYSKGGGGDAIMHYIRYTSRLASNSQISIQACCTGLCQEGIITSSGETKHVSQIFWKGKGSVFYCTLPQLYYNVVLIFLLSTPLHAPISIYSSFIIELAPCQSYYWCIHYTIHAQELVKKICMKICVNTLIFYQRLRPLEASRGTRWGSPIP